MTVDAMGILGGVDEETMAAELEMASIAVDPVLNAEFAAGKGPTALHKPL